MGKGVKRCLTYDANAPVSDSEVDAGATGNTSATGNVVPNSPVPPDATGDAASTDATIGLARIPSGVFAGTIVPPDAISATHSPAGLVAVPVASVQTPPPVQQPLPATPNLTGTPIPMVDLYYKDKNNEVASFYGIVIDDEKIKLRWVPGDTELLLNALPSPISAMQTPPIRRVLPTDFSPSAVPASKIADRMKRIRRKLSMYEAELSFFRAQMERFTTPPPGRITSVYSPAPARAQTVPRTPPTGSGTHSSPVVIGDSPVVLD